MKKITILIAIIILINSISVLAAVPQTDSDCYLLAESNTGVIICEKNAHKRVKIASLTKIMTVLLALEAVDRGELKLTDMVTCSEYAESMGGSQIFLETGEEMTLDDILKAVMVVSANDAAIALAEHVGGNYENFIALMNKRAKELGMKNTHYTDANGLSDDDEHYSSAADMLIVSRELLKHKKIYDYTKIRKDTLRDGEFDLHATNTLLAGYEGATGLKTGYTSEALYCMVATAEREGKAYISIVLGAPTTEERFGASKRLLDYAFNDIKITDRIEKGEALGEAVIKRGAEKTVSAVAKEQIAAVSEKNEPASERKIEIKELEAPVKKGDVVGIIELVNNGKVIASTELVAAEDVEEKSFFGYFSDFAKAFLGIF